MNTNLGAKTVAAVIYQISMKDGRCRKKEYYIQTGYTYQSLYSRSKRLRKPPSSPGTLEWFVRSEGIYPKIVGAALSPRTGHWSPVREGNWQNLCHVSRRRSCGCQMSC